MSFFGRNKGKQAGGPSSLAPAPAPAPSLLLLSPAPAPSLFPSAPPPQASDAASASPSSIGRVRMPRTIFDPSVFNTTIKRIKKVFSRTKVAPAPARGLGSAQKKKFNREDFARFFEANVPKMVRMLFEGTPPEDINTYAQQASGYTSQEVRGGILRYGSAPDECKQASNRASSDDNIHEFDTPEENRRYFERTPVGKLLEIPLLKQAKEAQTYMERAYKKELPFSLIKDPDSGRLTQVSFPILRIKNCGICHLCCRPVYAYYGIRDGYAYHNPCGECEHKGAIFYNMFAFFLASQGSNAMPHGYGFSHVHCNQAKSNTVAANFVNGRWVYDPVKAEEIAQAICNGFGGNVHKNEYDPIFAENFYKNRVRFCREVTRCVEVSSKEWVGAANANLDAMKGEYVKKNPKLKLDDVGTAAAALIDGLRAFARVGLIGKARENVKAALDKAKPRSKGGGRKPKGPGKVVSQAKPPPPLTPVTKPRGSGRMSPDETDEVVTSMTNDPPPLVPIDDYEQAPPVQMAEAERDFYVPTFVPIDDYEQAPPVQMAEAAEPQSSKNVQPTPVEMNYAERTPLQYNAFEQPVEMRYGTEKLSFDNVFNKFNYPIPVKIDKANESLSSASVLGNKPAGKAAATKKMEAYQLEVFRESERVDPDEDIQDYINISEFYGMYSEDIDILIFLAYSSVDEIIEFFSKLEELEKLDAIIDTEYKGAIDSLAEFYTGWGKLNEELKSQLYSNIMSVGKAASAASVGKASAATSVDKKAEWLEFAESHPRSREYKAFEEYKASLGVGSGAASAEVGSGKAALSQLFWNKVDDSMEAGGAISRPLRRKTTKLNRKRNSSRKKHTTIKHNKTKNKRNTRKKSRA